MQNRDGKTLYSTSDLVNYIECEHLTALDLLDLETPLLRAAADEQAKLIRTKATPRGYLADLKAAMGDVVNIKAMGQGIEAEVEATRAAVRQGAAVIYQACFQTDDIIGYVDFRAGWNSSELGDYSYEVVDAELARSPKAKFILQLCMYAELLADIQRVLPRHIHVILGDRTEQSFRLANYFRYRKLKASFLVAVSRAPGSTYPLPCSHCDLCDWRELCQQQWNGTTTSCWWPTSLATRSRSSTPRASLPSRNWRGWRNTSGSRACSQRPWSDCATRRPCNWAGARPARPFRTD